MRKVCWILFASACVLAFPPRAALILEDLAIFLLGIWLGLILAMAYPAK